MYKYVYIYMYKYTHMKRNKEANTRLYRQKGAKHGSNSISKP